jgi:hypothetical protein
LGQHTHEILVALRYPPAVIEVLRASAVIR